MWDTFSELAQPIRLKNLAVPSGVACHVAFIRRANALLRKLFRSRVWEGVFISTQDSRRIRNYATVSIV